jgi:hypothetical protein
MVNTFLSEFLSKVADNGRGYEIVADYEQKAVKLHRTTYEQLPLNYQLQPLCFIAFVNACYSVT